MKSVCPATKCRGQECSNPFCTSTADFICKFCKSTKSRDDACHCQYCGAKVQVGPLCTVCLSAE